MLRFRKSPKIYYHSWGGQTRPKAEKNFGPPPMEGGADTQFLAFPKILKMSTMEGGPTHFGGGRPPPHGGGAKKICNHDLVQCVEICNHENPEEGAKNAAPSMVEGA